MKVSSRLSVVSLVVALAGCGASSTPAETAATASDPCHGHDLVLADVMAHCMTDGPAQPAPDARALRASADPATVASGETVQVVLTFENATSNPMELWMERPSASFGTSIWNGETRVDETGAELFASISGCSGDCRPVRVVLEPGGSLRGAVDVAARVTHLTTRAVDGPLEEIVGEDAGPLAAGTYTVTVTLPWADVDASGTHVERSVTAPFVVTP